MTRFMMNAEQARAVLWRCDLPSDNPADFYTINAERVARLIEQADRMGYRAPKNANGSRARYFYAYVLRSLNRK